MYKIIVAGSGKVGSLIALLLAHTGRYDVTVLDKDFAQEDSERLKDVKHIHRHLVDINNKQQMHEILASKNYQGIISSLPFFCNILIAEYAKVYDLHYFDLTEDNKTAQAIKLIAQNSEKVFIPRCGLAPGVIGLIATHLMREFDVVREAKLRVGALPLNSNNVLKYALTWSTDGLINQYANPCYAIVNKKPTYLQPLEGMETINIDGISYEAFNTSGGIGNLVDLFEDKIENINYKTIRYPGHCQVMDLLLNGLYLERDRGNLKKILENAIPKTYEDVVIIYVSISGFQGTQLLEKNCVLKLHSDSLFNYKWSAMQLTTASSVSAVVDMVMNKPAEYRGYFCQELLDYQAFIANPFGKIYQT